jgi:hypothetical protein
MLIILRIAGGISDYTNHTNKTILQRYFVRGKQRFLKVYIIDGITADEFYEKNADPVTLVQNSDYELLDEHRY